MIKKFIDLPLGTRFKYVDGSSVWVILEHHGYGKIARWTNVGQHKNDQTICSMADSEEECKTIEVELVDALP
jgi:predicted type IV restriction endonuclease